jgi:hypothetical protein
VTWNKKRLSDRRNDNTVFSFQFSVLVLYCGDFTT